LVALDGWQLLFFRGATWSNPMSGADAVTGIAPPADAAIPQGVRLSIQPASGPLAQGTLTLDWALQSAGETL
jgi:general secretion pathway protein J